MFNRLQFARVYSIMVFVGDLAISTNIDSQRREIFMNKMELLKQRTASVLNASKNARARIEKLVDENSFVELSAFTFSKNAFYNEDVEGEGVVCGYATIDEYSFYVIAQNEEVFSGGISKASCDKMCKCLDAAEKNATPVVYILNTRGVQIGEGVTVLEGLSKVLMRATQLKGVVPQYVIVDGDVYGSLSVLAAVADLVLFVKGNSTLAVNSPFVLSAKDGKNVKKEEIAALPALDKTGLSALEVQDLAEAKERIAYVHSLLANAVVDAELNDSLPVLNESASCENLLGVFEDYIELGSVCESDVKTLLGRIGGIAVAAVLFDGGEQGVELTAGKLAKIKSFIQFTTCYNLPFISFADVLGFKQTSCVHNSRAMKETVEYLELLDTIDSAKISVVYKKAVGLGYSLFAAKSAGFDYTIAFANAKIALFDSLQGAKIEFNEKGVDENTLKERYDDEKADPIHAAKDGYLDCIIEPQFVKQYLISALQMLGK